MADPVSSVDLIMCAQKLRQDVFLDLSGVPKNRQSMINAQFSAANKNIESAAKMLMEAAVYGVQK